MSDNKPDILLIQKYLNGELDARAMHELERRALDDQFLADALEGYEARRKDQAANIADLQERLQQRIKPQKKRLALWPAISIAASVLVFIGVGGWWLLNYRPASNQPDLPVVDKTEVAKNKPGAVQAAPQPFKPKDETYKPQQQAVFKPSAPATQRFASPQPFTEANEQEIIKADVLADRAKAEANAFKAPVSDSLKKVKELDEVVVTGYVAQQRRDIAGSVATLHADTLAKARSSSVEQALAGRLAGVQVNDGATRKVRIRGVAGVPAKGDSVRVITGQIISRGDKQPLPGVTVRVGSSGLGVNTDARGRFKIAATDKDELNVIYIGFESQKIKVKGKDSLKILLKENTSALSEVVVVGYGTREPEAVINEAHPHSGWSAFNKYLDEEARVSTGKTGVVRISFVVGTDGELSDFKILKSLSPYADKEAIEIIKDGANWVPNTNKKPETVKLRIRFRKEK